MDFFLKRKNPESSEHGSNNKASNFVGQRTSIHEYVDINDLPYDPAKRKKISDYHPNQRDQIRRKYLVKGPCQPHGHDFPQRMIGNRLKRFQPEWFAQYGNWLEYSTTKDKAFCLCCYLFRDAGNDAFVINGFSCWNKTERLSAHVGDINSFHNKAVKKCDDLMTQAQSIVVALHKQSDITKAEHRIRLNASIDASRFLLHQGLPFRGHDESEESNNQGNFKELIKYTASQNEVISNVVLKNAPGNNRMVSPTIQKDIAHCLSQEVIRSILEEIGDDVFALLVDESSDVSYKEQMSVVLRFVDKFGIIKERFVGIIHVKDTSSLSLKDAIDSLFSELGLSLKSVRGQGYDGASNMKGEFNGLRALILQENSSAYYVHCFAHQLQLVVVGVSKKHFEVGDFFDKLSLLLNVVGASCKRRHMVREGYREKIIKELCNHEIRTGSGLNQELALQRPGNTRWGSHYKTLLRLVDLFPIVLKMLEYIEEEGTDTGKRRQANGLLKYMQSFEFVFYLHLMLQILGLTESLSMVLQRKDQDILNAMSMVASAKRQLQVIRDSEGSSLMIKVSSFCEKYDVQSLMMGEEFIDTRRPRKKSNITNLQHFQVDCFYPVLDLVLQEFNDRFDEVNSELLICMVSLSPTEAFRHFDISKLVRLAEFYSDDFDFGDRMTLEHQLPLYIDNIREDGRFSNLTDIGTLAKIMVDTKKHLAYPLIFRLLKLVLTLPVATATVERCFSAMKIVKTNLRNRIADSFMSDCLICYIEKDIFGTIKNEDVVERFMKMKTRREQL
ncbi:unnamed protein product [Rhodiola kirilowii]